MHAPAILLFQSDVPQEADRDFNKWMQQEKLPACLALPGVRRVRRYRAVEAQPTYLTVCDCDEAAALASPAFRMRDEASVPHAPLRTVCTESWTAGRGTGGGAVLVHCRPTTRDRIDDARRFIRESFAPPLMQADHVVRMALWETDPASGPAEVPAQWMLFIESLDLSRTMLALHAHVLYCVGAHTGLLISTWTKYQLIFECEAESAARAARTNAETQPLPRASAA